MWKKRYGSTGLLSLIVVMMALAPAAQAQLSETRIVSSDVVDGDFFGESIAIDGNRLVVGVRLADIGNDENAGAVYVFEKKDGEWKEVQKLIASDGDDGFFFGEEVAIKDDWIFVGAVGNDGLGIDGGGAAYAFQYNHDTGLWEETQIIFPSDPQRQKFFGWGLAFDGTRLVVGGPRDDEVSIQGGGAYVFELENDEWEEDEKLVPPSNLAAFFGSAIALDGDRMIIGSLVDDEAADNAGAAYIFELIAGQWQFTDKLLPPPVALPDSLESDTFAREVALEGDWALIGSTDDERCIGEEGADPNHPNVCSSGAVFAFQRQSDGDWDFKQKIAPEELDRFDFFGVTAIAIENGRAFIGALGDDDACPDPPPPPIFCDTGAAYVYDLVGDEWQKTDKLTAADPDSLEGMGGLVIGQGVRTG